MHAILPPFTIQPDYSILCLSAAWLPRHGAYNPPESSPALSNDDQMMTRSPRVEANIHSTSLPERRAKRESHRPQRCATILLVDCVVPVRSSPALEQARNAPNHPLVSQRGPSLSRQKSQYHKIVDRRRFSIALVDPTSSKVSSKMRKAFPMRASTSVISKKSNEPFVSTSALRRHEQLSARRQSAFQPRTPRRPPKSAH